MWGYLNRYRLTLKTWFEDCDLPVMVDTDINAHTSSPTLLLWLLQETHLWLVMALCSVGDKELLQFGSSNHLSEATWSIWVKQRWENHFASTTEKKNRDTRWCICPHLHDSGSVSRLFVRHLIMQPWRVVSKLVWQFLLSCQGWKWYTQVIPAKFCRFNNKTWREWMTEIARGEGECVVQSLQ